LVASLKCDIKYRNLWLTLDDVSMLTSCAVLLSFPYICVWIYNALRYLKDAQVPQGGTNAYLAGAKTDLHF